MTDEEIKDRIFDIVAKEARLDRSSLKLESRLDEANISSLDMVNILFGIEDTFDVYIPQDNQNFTLATMSEVVDGVKRLIVGKRPA